MNYEVDQIVQFGYICQNNLHVMVGKILRVTGSSTGVPAYELAVASDSNFPHKNEDGSEVEKIVIPFRMMGRIVPVDEPSDKLVFNWRGESRIGWLAKVNSPEGREAIGRILGVSFSQDGRFTYYVALSKKAEGFEKLQVPKVDWRGGVFVQLEPKKQVVALEAQLIVDSKNISEKQRSDNKLYRETYFAILERKIKALNLKRRTIKVVHNIVRAETVKPDHHNADIKALHDVKAVLWYAFTTDDHYLSYSTHLRDIVTNPKRKDFIGFMPSEVDFDYAMKRPEPRDVILTREIHDPDKKANPPVAWMLASEEVGLDVFNTYFQTAGTHKIFTGRSPEQIIAMCEGEYEDGSRAPTMYSELLQGYFHKNFRCETVDEFREHYLWFFN